MLGALDQLHNRGIELVVAGAEAEHRRAGQRALADRTGKDAGAAFCKYPARPDERGEGPSEGPQEWQAGAAKPRTGRAGDKAGGSDGDQGNS